MTDAPGSRRRLWWWIGGGAVVALAIAAALVFQPWLLFVDVRVDDDIPLASAAPTSEPSAGATASPAAGESPSPSTPPPPAGPVELSRGTLISHEHETTGTVRVIRLPDGSRQLAIENLDTTNGPDVHVWLSAGPVVEGFDGWFTAGGHPYVDLGLIKGNQGNQVYDIPADVDLSAYPTVDLWCVQFAVSFGAAALTAS
ncbi:DM13 domain-containing protein [Agromyces sp. H66]|uniref:DM13 domain-containing protein n=1 Tax=Agromyces sp. H66 TaxID=2529859 RepID=UPI0010A9D56B|nr:DM13 domain-containing protein [Agromyces sp. H66]